MTTIGLGEHTYTAVVRVGTPTTQQPLGVRMGDEFVPLAIEALRGVVGK